jgi:ubiquinone/menaquinone biosynthesis C-methylase UbiE
VAILVDSPPDERTKDTVKQFGDSWTTFDHMEGYHEAQFLDWIAPLAREDFAGKIVLEAGCGKGRHARAVSAWDPAGIFAVDLSEAVFIAARNTTGLENATCVQANLLQLPFGDGTFDMAYCVGVLHHLEDPRAGLGELWRVLKPGGALCLWVYAREGNGWVVALVDPVRKGVTSRLPVSLLKWVARPLSGFLFTLLKVLYGPITRRGAKRAKWLPYSSYLGKISPFPFREVDNIVLDHLCPPIAFYLSRPQLEEWFALLNPESVQFRWHNRNSWTIVAKRAK